MKFKDIATIISIFAGMSLFLWLGDNGLFGVAAAIGAFGLSAFLFAGFINSRKSRIRRGR